MIDLLTKQVVGVLENRIFTQINSLGIKVPNQILRAVISRAAEEASVLLVKNVTLGTNKQLNEIPRGLEGLRNPVDLVSSNFGPKDITNNLAGILQVQYSSQITNAVVTKLESELRKVLPANKLNLINFSALAATLVQSLTPTINSAITSVLSSVAGNIFGTNKTDIRSTISGIDKFFSQSDSDTALTRIDGAFAASTAGTALEEAKKFDINAPENQEKLIVIEKGFLDPNANYPTKEYENLPDTNKLAQGEIKGTVVQNKNNTLMKGAKLPYGESWDQPESPYRAQYPYNKVTQTESGHIIEVDDTPGSERLQIYHRSGTFVEIDANGSVVKRTIGSSYEIIDRNGKIAISGRADISVNGACNIFVGNDANIEVEGDVNLTCHNDITAQAGGTFNMSAKEEVNITGGNVNIQAYDVFNVKGDNVLSLHSNVIHTHSNADIKIETLELNVKTINTYLQSTEDIHIKGDNLYQEAVSDINEKAGGTIFNFADSDVNIKATGSIYNDAGSEVNIVSGSDTNIDTGGTLYENSGTATGASNASGATDAQNSVIAGSSKIGVLDGRKDIAANELNDPVALTLADNKSLLLEEETVTADEATEQKNLIISKGFATAAEIDEAPIAIESETPSSSQNNFVEPDENLKKVTQLPGNYNLSPNFTLEMLSSKAAVSNYPVQAQNGLTYGELVYNLQAIALNVLEPVKKLYPNMFVTSAFRPFTSNKTSQHILGQAVDIQFKGITKQEYYDISLKLAKVLRYDQMLLEFCNYTKNPWIHISYSVEKNRIQTMTFFNHKKYSDGFTQLA
jgi:uncharacterized protein YcbK (DUF882 family)